MTLHSALSTGYLDSHVLGPALGATECSTLKMEGFRAEPSFIPDPCEDCSYCTDVTTKTLG